VYKLPRRDFIYYIKLVNKIVGLQAQLSWDPKFPSLRRKKTAKVLADKKPVRDLKPLKGFLSGEYLGEEKSSLRSSLLRDHLFSKFLCNAPLGHPRPKKALIA